MVTFGLGCEGLLMKGTSGHIRSQMQWQNERKDIAYKSLKKDFQKRYGQILTENFSKKTIHQILLLFLKNYCNGEFGC